ncbi:hypothetical protein [Spirosoma validum]|uniref:Uncharacterized protein n=1 Tax=Spirosoma validum TaxID=2771355 RepID=A0A927B7X8_9BACT|nr:hypothetical protein [Spirosoma validum]MBD2757110.1 hypothetical protein [Spirosoma validum]
MMNATTKKDLLYAFRKRNTKRRDLLFLHYQEWFESPLTADVLAQKISDDLGIEVGPSIIYHIRSKHKPRRSKLAMKSVGKSVIVSPNPQALAVTVPDLDSLTKQSSLIQFLAS